MTAEQVRQTEALLLAVELWLQQTLAGDAEDRAEQRRFLIETLDEFVSAMQLEDHGGLGRGGTS